MITKGHMLYGKGYALVHETHNLNFLPLGGGGDGMGFRIVEKIEKLNVLAY